MITSPPLAEQLRPTDLDNYLGQQHLTGSNAVLRKSIESGNIPSMILWGPPGVGKTTLAFIISKKLRRAFYTLSAINSGVKDVRDVIQKAQSGLESSILFIDEIHRFNKSQQDSLLGAVERGIITLIGATTENPSFEVIAPLLSRCQVYILKPLTKADMDFLLNKATEYYKKSLNIDVQLKERAALMQISGGDARKLLNALELTVNARQADGKNIYITDDIVRETIQAKLAIYDKSGEMHYDIISAFIKSLRGSDPNAAVYWLARMIEAGEDPKFIARRMVILASEDIGNANPNALVLATSCFDAVNLIGMPESRIILSQTAVYLATSAKSNASYQAINLAQEEVKKSGDLSVPFPIRNAPTKLMKEIGYGDKYKYAHSYEGNFADMEFLPDAIKGKKFYEPGNNAKENSLREFLKSRWKKKYGY